MREGFRGVDSGSETVYEGFLGVDIGSEAVCEGFQGVDSASEAVREGLIPGHIREGDRVSRFI